MRFLLFVYLICLVLCKNIDPYKTLNVPHSATQKQIKSAYKKLALKNHPDKHPEQHEKYTKIMQELSEAYNILNDPAKKRQYDQEQKWSRRSGHTYFRDTDDRTIGIKITNHNYESLIREMPDQTWFVYVYSQYNCRTCDKAHAIFEDVCNTLKGVIRCGKVSRDLDYQFVSQTLGIRRLPAVVAFRNGKKNKVLFQYGKHDAIYFKNAIAKVYDANLITSIKNENQLKKFLTTSTHFTRGIILSTKTSKPHIYLLHAADVFKDTIQFGFVYNSNHEKMKQLRTILNVDAEGSVLVMVNSYAPLAPTAQHFEISLEVFNRDPVGLVESIKQRNDPDFPLLTFQNYADLCYKKYGEFDSFQTCFLVLMSTKIDNSIALVVNELSNEELRIVAVNCAKQTNYCNSFGRERSKIQLVGVSAHLDVFKLYRGGWRLEPIMQFVNEFSKQVEQLHEMVDNGIPKDTSEYFVIEHQLECPDELLDAFTKAKRNFINPFADAASGGGSLIVSGISSVWWFVETVVSTFISFAIPMLLFGSLFLGGRVRVI